MSKLTLNVDSELIEAAKAYSRERNISLSKLVARYLSELTASAQDDFIAQLHQELKHEGYQCPKTHSKLLRQRHVEEKYL